MDWGGVSHAPGGSHGALDRGDSLAPLVLVGLDEAGISDREQWTLRDISELVVDHFGRQRAGSEPAVEPVGVGAPTLDPDVIE